MAGCGRLFVPVGSINFFNSRCWFINSSKFISTKTKKSVEHNLLLQKPKKPLTPFFKYLKIMRPSLTIEFPQLKVTEIVKKISERWTVEDRDYKLKLHDEYDTEYKQYMKKIIEYEKSITPEQREKLLTMEYQMQAEVDKAKRKHNLRVLGKPKKPPSAFLLYMVEMMKIRESDTSTQEYVKNLSYGWKNMNEQDKKEYQTRAAKLMDQYFKQKTEWEQRMIQEERYKTKETVIHGKATNDTLFLQV